jgi:hypothetical protein
MNSFLRIIALLICLTAAVSCSDDADKALLKDIEQYCGCKFPINSSVISNKSYSTAKVDSFVVAIQVPEKSIAELSSSIRSSAFYSETHPALAVFNYNYKNKPVWVHDSPGYTFIGHSCKAKFDTLSGIFNYKSTSY